MGKIIAITNLKGGVGKTTTAINLASSLGALEKKVLLIDADPQANASLGLCIDKVDHGFYQFLTGLSKPIECIDKKTSLYFNVIPADLNLTKIEFENKKERDNNYLIKEKLNLIKENYDYIIIDSPPSLGAILLNILSACDSILVPVQCEHFAFHGLKKLFVTIKRIRETINPDLDIEGILITMFNGVVKEHRHIADLIREQFQSLVFNTAISQNIKLAEASSFGKPIIEHNANCIGALNYLQLAEEVINNSISQNPTYNTEQENQLLEIFQEDIIEDLDFILNIKQELKLENIHNKNKGYNYLIGLSKNEVKEKLGQLFNDMNSDIWMYRINKKFSFLKKNYLYINFSKDKVISFSLKKFKINDLQERV